MYPLAITKRNIPIDKGECETTEYLLCKVRELDEGDYPGMKMFTDALNEVVDTTMHYQKVVIANSNREITLNKYNRC